MARLLAITNELFGLGEQLNMSLENQYPTGRHAIAEHSDNEDAMQLPHVFCWVAGPAARELVLRTRRRADCDQSKQEREVCRAALPAGLYVMHGRAFQATYTHEFPQLHKALFARLKQALRAREGYPREESELVQAEWMAQHADVVEGAIRPDEVELFREWMLPRTSHTLRAFRQ